LYHKRVLAFYGIQREKFVIALKSGRDVGGSFPESEKLIVSTFKIVGSRYFQSFVGAINIFDLKSFQRIKLQYFSKFTFISA
jgi:hypothetical protein